MMILNLFIALSLLFNYSDKSSSRGTVAHAVCTAKPFIDKATSDLSGYNFLKAYTIDKKEVTFPYICTAGQVYMVRLDKGGDASGVYVSIQDASGNEITKSYQDGKYNPGAGFKCGKTGQYKIVFKFAGADGYCAGGALGFKRD